MKAYLGKTTTIAAATATATATTGLIKGMTPAEYKHQWYLANKARLSVKSSQYKKDHPEQQRAYSAKWRNNNKAAVMASQTSRRNKRTTKGLNTHTGKPLQVITGRIYMAESAGRVKIGRSIDANSRKYDLNTSSPFPVKMLWESDEIVGVNFVEKALHTKYKDKQVHGEWFDLKPTNIKHIKTSVNKITTADHTVVV